MAVSNMRTEKKVLFQLVFPEYLVVFECLRKADGRWMEAGCVGRVEAD